MTRNNRIPLSLLALFACAFLLSQLDPRPGFSLPSDWFGSDDRLARLETLNRVLYHIQESYVDPERIKPKEMFDKALDNISSAVPEVRVLRPSPKRALLMVDQERKEFDTELVTSFGLRASLSDALRFIRSHRRSDVSDEDLETEAIRGVLATLDPHSHFLTPEMYKEMTSANAGVFGGLGIEIGVRNEKLTVLRPLKNTPASRAGLAAGDVITRIGEDSTRNMALDEAVDRLRGPKGTRVTITVARKEWAAEREFTLTRAEINVASVESALLPERVAYVRIKSFQKNTARDLAAHVKQLHEQAAAPFRGLILDLRNDPGGLLDQAIAVTDTFLKEGVIVTTLDMNTKLRKQEKATGRGTETGPPMVVLVNGNSASASEIVAGALQRQGRAILVGEKTFGKGTVQSIFELPGKSALKLTVAKYLTPGDISIQSIGIAPEVRLVPATVSSERIDIFPGTSRVSERSLDHHFDNPEAAKLSLEPVASLRYLETRTDKEIAEEETRLNARRDDPKAFVEDLRREAVIRLSSEIVTRTAGGGRNQLLEAAKQSVAVLERAETAKIAAALARKSIDWADAPNPNGARCGTPRASTRILERSGPIRAGETVRWAVTLENPGPCTLYQAWTRSSARYYLFDDREFLFGRIPPGGKATRDVTLEVPSFAPTSLTRVSFQFKEGRNVAPSEFEAMLPIERAPAPRFAFHYTVRDAGQADPKERPDGLIQPGETVELRVQVRNVGPAEATEGVASIRQEGEKTLRFRRTHVPLPVLKPKEETTARFSIQVPPSFRGEEFDLDLSIADVKSRVFLTQKIGFRVIPRGKMPAVPRPVAVKEASVPIQVFPWTGSAVIARAGQGVPLASAGSFEDYLRIKLPPDGYGWIRKEAVAPGEGAKQRRPEWVFQEGPFIEDDLEKRALHPVTGQFLEINGTLLARESLKDLLVFVNEKKAFYRNFADLPEARKQPFHATVPLEGGTNRILLVARDRDDLVEKKAVIFQRSDAPDPSENERNEETDYFLFSPGY